MIVYLFNDRICVTVKLPIQISGMYPIYVNGKIIANIIAEQGRWFIQLSSDFVSQDMYAARTALIPYKIFNFKSRTNNEKFFLVATPKYDPDARTYVISDALNSITIGSDPNCDIHYDLGFSKDEFIRISRNNEQWVAETNSPYFFVAGDKIINGQRIYSGDNIFFYGLKIIIIGPRLVINNPNGQISIRDGVLHTLINKKKLTQIQNDQKSEKEIDVQDDLPLFSKDDYFYKAPRFNYLVEEASVDIDEPPKPERDDDTPTILKIGPQLTMAGASVFSMFSMMHRLQ